MPRDPGKIRKQIKQCNNALFQCHSQIGGLVPVEKLLKGINLLNLIPGATQLTQIRDGSFVQLWAALKVISKIWIEIAICISLNQASLYLFYGFCLSRYCPTFQLSVFLCVYRRDISYFSNVHRRICLTNHQRTHQTLCIRKPIHPGYLCTPDHTTPDQTKPDHIRPE